MLSQASLSVHAAGVRWPRPSGAAHHEIDFKVDQLCPFGAETAAPLIKLPRQYDPARNRDALVVAGLLSTLLHLALLKWLVAYSQAPAA